MSDNTKDKAFLDLADQFIALANNCSESIDRGTVSAAFLYAAARFNTYVVATSAPDAQTFSSYQPKAMAYFQDEYKKTLNEHFADYEENFDIYMTTDNSGNTLN